jgi:heat-inducible transcriptional repressor
MAFELGPRAREVLYATITEFIATGEPVGSRTLSKKYGIALSPASIRNVLSDLEDGGFLQQPHTSAGRVPTERAFRFFIDALMHVREVTEAERGAIEQRFEVLSPRDNVLREAARLLSSLTGAAAVVVAPPIDAEPLQQLRFIVTRPGTVLAVVVTASGYVENRFVSVPNELSKSDVVRIQAMIDEIIEGHSLAEVRDICRARLAQTKSQVHSLQRQAFELGSKALESTHSVADLVVEGESLLLDQPEFSDRTRVKELLSVLGERQKLLSILDRMIENEGVRVVLPSDEQTLGIQDVSVVAARYGDDVQGGGRIGVIGPTRMNYPSIMPIVAKTASELAAFFGRK